MTQNQCQVLQQQVKEWEVKSDLDAKKIQDLHSAVNANQQTQELNRQALNEVMFFDHSRSEDGLLVSLF